MFFSARIMGALIRKPILTNFINGDNMNNEIFSAGNDFSFYGEGCGSDVFGRLVCNGQFVQNLNKCNEEYCTYCSLNGCSLVSNRLEVGYKEFGVIVFLVLLLSFATYKAFN